ncbi:MAG TPA: peptidoglycan-binding domain-containing protein [Pseudolabrys sp.]|nr:peptidoglycan-binding domain-containing protein [Pseudolabrys sp.]
MRRRSARKGSTGFDSVGRTAAAIAQHPREFVAVVMSTIAVFAIVTNALFLQKGPHPAPIFAAHPLLQQQQGATSRPQTVASSHAGVDPGAQARTQLVANIQRELARKGFYDGLADGIWGSKTDAAVRDFLLASGSKTSPEASENLLRAISGYSTKPTAVAPPGSSSGDPIAKLIAPSKRIVAVQRALADFGYGQIKATGAYDPETRSAIEKFERDHRLPVTGQLSERLVRELAAMTGRPLE